MNETELIFAAIRQPMPVRKRKKVMYEIEPDPIDNSEPDAIAEIVKKKKALQKRELKRKRRPVSQWSNLDFLSHVNSLLLNYGGRLESATVTDCEVLSSAYDSFADLLGRKMSNAVLKEYLEWWVNCFGSTTANNAISIRALVPHHLLQKFASRYLDNIPVKHDSKKPVTVSTVPSVSMDDLYDHGGLPMVLMSYGIVNAYHLLTKRNDPKAFEQIISALKSLSKKVLDKVMSRTLELAPYNGERVDFVSLAKAALDYHNLAKFKSVQYGDYFTQG